MSAENLSATIAKTTFAKPIYKFYDHGSKFVIAHGYELKAYDADTLQPLWQHNFSKKKKIAAAAANIVKETEITNSSSADSLNKPHHSVVAAGAGSIQEGILMLAPIMQSVLPLPAQSAATDRGESVFAMIVTDQTQRSFGCKTVCIWNQKTNATLSVAFRNTIYNLLLSPEYLIVVTEHEIAIVSTTSLSTVKTITTCSNKLGLVDIVTRCSRRIGKETTDVETLVLVPATKTGAWRIEQLPPVFTANSFSSSSTTSTTSTAKLPTAQPSHDIVETHAHDLSLLRFDPTGQLVISASTQGTRIVVYNIDLKSQHTFRREKNSTTFADVAFHKSEQLLVIADATQPTIDVFTYEHLVRASNAKHSSRKNSSAAWGLLSAVNEYFNSEWSFAKHVIQTKSKADLTNSSTVTTSIAIPTPNANSASDMKFLNPSIQAIAVLPIPNKAAVCVLLDSDIFVRVIVDDSGKCIQDKIVMNVC